MSYPTPYNRIYNFVDYQTVNPSLPLPADQLEAELNAIEISLDETQSNLAAIQRSDNKLGNLVVHPESLDSATLTLIGNYTLRGAWITATAYAVRDLVTQGGNLYICFVAHTSGTFATDLAANKWLTLSKTGLQPDGSVNPTANQPMAGFKFTNLGAGTARTDSINLGQAQDESIQWGAVSGSANAITLTLTPAVTANQAGQRFAFKATADNTNATTVNWGGGVVAVQRNAAALTGGEIKTGRSYMLLFDGTAAQLFSFPDLPLAIAQGGTGQVTALAAFDALKQSATTSYPGVAEIADQTETNAGTDTGKPVTPSTLWNAPIRGGWRNIVGANGGFEVWQRGAGGSASIAVAASSQVYTADRWYLAVGANQASVVSQQAGLVVGSRYCVRVQRNAGQTGVGQIMFGFPLDPNEVIPLQGAKVYLRVLLRAGANWSPLNGTVTATLFVGTAAAPAKRALGAYTGETLDLSGSVNLTPGGAVTTLTVGPITLPSNIQQGELSLLWTPTGTAGAADYVEIDDVMLEAAPVVTTFERRPFDEELRACQRHFFKTFLYNVAPAQNAGLTNVFQFAVAKAGAVLVGGPTLPYPVEMRVAPTPTFYNPSATNAFVRNRSTNTDATTTAPDATGTTRMGFSQTGLAGWAAGDSCAVHVSADSGI